MRLANVAHLDFAEEVTSVIHTTVHIAIPCNHSCAMIE